MADEEKDPGSTGGKLSKFDPDKEREKQRVVLWNKWFDARDAFFKELTAENLASYEKYRDEYVRQYDQ